MKNKIKKILFLVFSFVSLFFIENVYAEEIVINKPGIIITDKISFRKEANSSSTLLSKLDIGSTVTVNSSTATGNGCSVLWYNVTYNKTTGYICGSYLSIELETNKDNYLYTVGDKSYRTIPNTSSSSYLIGDVTPGTMLKVIKQVKANSTCSAEYWYYVDYNEKKGWICGYNVSLIPSTTTDDQYFITRVLSKFPKSYHPYLIDLYVKHPTWTFEAYKTGVSFATAVAKESKVGVSLVQTKYQGFLSTDSAAYDYATDTFYVKEGSSWYAANSSVVAFYLDPRNYLTENYIFAFEKLSYDEKSHTIDTVKSILENSYLINYADNFMAAAKETSVSPVHLASRSYQELGSSTVASSGTTGFTCNGTTYTGGYYNFYNTGATTGSNPVLTGLCYASIANASYGRAWNTPQKAITGGAWFIAKGYVNNGQDTLYLQKWDIKNGTVGSHQYMTNVAAAKSEASSTYSGYNKNNLIETPFVFKIPVYTDMPENLSSLPLEGNPNNWLKTITINGTVLDTFDIDSQKQTINVSSTTSTINFGALPVNSNATVTGTGTIDIDKTPTITITVKAQNKTTRDYTFTFVKVVPTYTDIQEIIDNMGVKNDGTYISSLQGKTTADIISEIKSKNADAVMEFKDKDSVLKTDVKFKTGDKMVVSLNKESKTYTIVVNGDTNGDGDITILDLLKIQKHILNSNPLSNEYLKSADVNGDLNITILDLLKVQKHLLGQGTIE